MGAVLRFLGLNAGRSAPPDEPSGCAPGGPDCRSGAGCSVAADPSLLADGTDGCGAGWSSPPKGRPLKTTNATKRRTAPNATALRLTRSLQRFASSTVAASSSGATFGGAGRHSGTERLMGPVRTASCREGSLRGPGRRGGLDGLTGTVAGSIRAVLLASRSSRTVLSTVPARLTASRQCARTASYSAASSCGLGRRSGTEGLWATVSRSRRAALSIGCAQ